MQSVGAKHFVHIPPSLVSAVLHTVIEFHLTSFATHLIDHQGRIAR